MGLTRAAIEGILVRRCRARLAAAGLSTLTDGSNPDLNDALCQALRALGLAAADAGSVTDADLAAVTAEQIDALLDVAELRTLETVAGNLALVDVAIGPRREELSQLADQVEKAIARLQRKIEREHGLGAGALEYGVLRLNFAEKGEDGYSGR